MKKILALFTIITLGVFMFGCKKPEKAVVASNFFSYDAAKHIVGDKFPVKLGFKPGTSGHSQGSELTNKIKYDIKNAFLFIYTSNIMNEHIVKDPKKLPGDDHVLYLWDQIYPGEKEPDIHGHNHEHTSNQNLDLNKIVAHEGHEHKHGSEHAKLHAKIHYWADPRNVVLAAKAIKDKMVKLDPDNKTYYEDNFNKYHESFHEVVDGFKQYLETLTPEVRKTPIFFIGHDSIGAFAQRFGLEYDPMQPTPTDNAPIKPEQKNHIIEEIKEHNVKIIFKPELGEADQAVNSIIEQLKKDNYIVDALELNGYHNITKKQFEDNTTYLQLLKQNIDNIKQLLK